MCFGSLWRDPFLFLYVKEKESVVCRNVVVSPDPSGFCLSWTGHWNRCSRYGVYLGLVDLSFGSRRRVRHTGPVQRIYDGWSVEEDS